MSERGSTMVSDQDIAQALENLFCEANPSSVTFNSLNGVVQQLESKLGSNLTHKIDFIRAQIHHILLRNQAQQQPPQQLRPKDHFALHQTSNFLPVASSQLSPNFTVHRPEEYVFRPPQLQQAPVTATAAAQVAPAVAAAPEAHKESAQTGRKRRGGPGGLNKLCGVSPELQTIVGQPTLPRTEIVKQLWAYIRKNNLQDPNNKRKIICNDELRLVFETDCTDMFKMNKLLAKHIIPLEPTKQAPQNAKKVKTDVESGSESAPPVPIVIISEALANFFGSGEREMSQAEVLRQMWEYIKANQLEDPMNSMTILCDAKLQELFGCESVSALGIPEMLARHHLFQRS